MNSSAEFSPCRTYRYTLTRLWSDEFNPCAFIGLNPSTADETEDDPTIRRCMRFAKDWGFGGLVMLNLFAIRSTDPMMLYGHIHGDIVGPQNDTWIDKVCRKSPLIVCAWGTHGELNGRGKTIAQRLRSEQLRPKCLGLTKNSHPKHPLYLRADTQPMDF